MVLSDCNNSIKRVQSRSVSRSKTGNTLSRSTVAPYSTSSIAASTFPVSIAVIKGLLCIHVLMVGSPFGLARFSSRNLMTGIMVSIGRPVKRGASSAASRTVWLSLIPLDMLISNPPLSKLNFLKPFVGYDGDEEAKAKLFSVYIAPTQIIDELDKIYVFTRP